VPEKRLAFFWVAASLSVLVIARVNLVTVSGWSNGGYSDDPSNPKYGTHDWIAHHALDWLPEDEKGYILANLSSYLYGTELPDNREASGGIGDFWNHHVYYFANFSVQDDASARRAQEEYDNAVNLFRSGDVVDATKKLGVMAHYISDLAVFAHVMGKKTEWGAVDRDIHEDYEGHVNQGTDSYDDDCNTYLAFDGVLSEITAYDAGLKLAYDTTFDVDGDLTCLWMNQTYDWSNETFRNRCGESLNLAVNLIADVLHTFYMREVVPEFPTTTIMPIFLVLVTCVIVHVKRTRSIHRT